MNNTKIMNVIYIQDADKHTDLSIDIFDNKK